MPEVVDVMRGILKCGMTTTADDNTWRRIRSALAKLEAKVDDDAAEDGDGSTIARTKTRTTLG
jgi:hypothetical protein